MTASRRSNSSAPLDELTRILSGLHRRLLTTSGGAQVAAVAQAGIDHVSGARWASVVLHRAGQARTLMATAPIARDIETLQQELGSGPDVDPVLEDNIDSCGDLAKNRRWPEFGPRRSVTGSESPV